MFDKDGKLDERAQRILSEQTIPPRYGRSPGMDAIVYTAVSLTEMADKLLAGFPLTDKPNASSAE